MDRLPILLLLLLPLLAAAVEQRGAPRSLDGGAPPATPYDLAPWLHYGGRLDFRLRDERNYDLDDAAPAARTQLQPLTLSLALHGQAGSWLAFYGNLRLEPHLTLATDETRQYEARLRLERLYLDLTDPARQWRLRLGRQRIKSRREWLLDDTLDGLTLSSLGAGPRWTAGLWRERAFRSDLLRPEAPKPVEHSGLMVRAPAGAEFGYLLYLWIMHDPRKDEDLHWRGGQLYGEWGEWDYWLQLARLDGRRRGKEVAGIGLDLGGIYRLRKRPRLYAILGLAYGSGHPRDVDRGFRQTGLQDNTDKLGGVTRMVYYGELLDPELANLAIATAGLGIRPRRDLSLHLVWHAYRQHYALAELRDSDLDRDPNGVSPWLGQGLDLVLGYRIRRRFKLEAVAAWFLPGPAYAPDRLPAHLLKLEARYNL